MKLATYRDGSRDGQLVVVSRDLTTAHYATHVAHTLQEVLDDWNFLSPQLQDLSVELNHGKARHVFPFDPAQCMAPLPRASQVVQASAWRAFREGLLRAQGAPALSRQVVALQPLSGDALAGAHDEVPLADPALGLDFEAGWAAFTADLPVGSTPARALEGVRLLALCNTWALRTLAEQEQAAGVPAVQSRPQVAFSPVVVSLDEVGEAWQQGRLGLTLHTHWNGRPVGSHDAAADMTLHMGQLLAQLAAQRPVRAGTVLCAAPVCAPWGPTPEATPSGYHSVAWQRAGEQVQLGCAQTAYVQPGDSVRIDMRGPNGLSLCGAINQTVVERD